MRILQLLLPGLGYAQECAPLQDFTDLDIQLLVDQFVENNLAFLIYAHCVRLKIILIHAAPEFTYPTQEFWDQHGSIKSDQVRQAAEAFDLDQEGIVEVFKSIFKNIALPVNILGSMQNIRHEAEGVCSELLAVRRNADKAHSGEEKVLMREYEESRRELANQSP